LARLKNYFSANPATAPDGITIVRHDDRAAWYSLKFDDPSIRDALEICAFIASLTEAQAQRIGVGADRDNTIDFTRGVGLYILSDR